MGKRLFIVLLAAILVATLSVSCDSSIKDGQEQTAMARFSVPQGKSLNRMNEQFEPEDYYWTYTAAKEDGNGLTTGETAAETKVDQEGGQGLANKPVGPFSMGSWKFSLTAYRNKDTDGNYTQKLYEGERHTVFSQPDGNIVAIEVSPLETGEGTILLSKGVALENLAGDYTKVVTVKNSEGVVLGVETGSRKLEAQTSAPSSTEEITVNVANPAADTSYIAASGAYSVTIAFNDANGVQVGASTVMLHVYGNLTTTVAGSLNQIIGSTMFSTNCGVTTATNEQTISSGNVTKFTVASTPVQTQVPSTSTETTEVEIPAGGLSGTNAQISITPLEPDSVERGNFTVSGDGAPVCGLDINLTVDGQPVTEFGSDGQGGYNKATVTTYIATGITPDPTVEYRDANGNASSEGIADVTYDSETGKLTFTTTHFSEFFVVSDSVVAINTTTNKAYGVGDDAWVKDRVWLPTMEASDGQELVLLKDVEIASNHRIQILEKFVLDLNGHKITKNYDASATNADPVFIIIAVSGEEIGNLTIKNGTVEGTAVTGSYDLFQVKAGASLTIESGTYKCTGALVISDGKVTVNGGNLIGDECVIITNGEQDGTSITINGGNIKGYNYFPAGGVYTITGGTFENAGTCVYQKSGTLEISGGSFTATDGGDGQWAHWGNGAFLTGDAVVVEACNYPAGNPTVNITGGTFEGFQKTQLEGNNPYKNYGVLLIDWREKEDSTEFNRVEATIADGCKQYCRKAEVTGHLSGDGKTAPTDGWMYFNDSNTTEITPPQTT